MHLHNTTPVPNTFFDYIPTLTHAEIRVLLVVIRQTHGWKNAKTGQRKIRDRLSYDYIIKRTGLYRTILSETIQQLIDLGLLVITDSYGNELKHSDERKGKRFLFYQFQHIRSFDTTYSQVRTTPIRSSEYNKRKTLKKKFLQKEQFEKLKELKQQLSNHLKMKTE